MKTIREIKEELQAASGTEREKLLDETLFASPLTIGTCGISI